MSEKILVICERCSKEWECTPYSQSNGIKKYGLNLCRGCKQREQIKLGIRGKQYINAGKSYVEKYKGKTLEEIVGTEKALLIKIKHSEQTKGEKNPNFNGKWHGTHPSINQKNKTYFDLYGERSIEIKRKISLSTSGKNNPMYGKPSPKGSGNGWSGWYNGWYFRSLTELSFMVNVIERFGFTWESGEKRKYMIPYIDYKGDDANYFPDFILNEKYMVEVKPKKLHNSDTNRRKRLAALEFCKKKGFKYKMLCPAKTLSFNDILLLIEQGKLEFTDRYKQKLKTWREEN